jgi:hypothetical protein
MQEGKVLDMMWNRIDGEYHGSRCSSHLWAKALGNLRRQHTPRTGDLGKVGHLRAAFRRDDSVYL